MLRMVGDYLEQHNMRAVSASGRQEMARHFTSGEPDLVILDLLRSFVSVVVQSAVLAI